MRHLMKGCMITNQYWLISKPLVACIMLNNWFNMTNYCKDPGLLFLLDQGKKSFLISRYVLFKEDQLSSNQMSSLVPENVFIDSMRQSVVLSPCLENMMSHYISTPNYSCDDQSRESDWLLRRLLKYLLLKDLQGKNNLHDGWRILFNALSVNLIPVLCAIICVMIISPLFIKLIFQILLWY